MSWWCGGMPPARPRWSFEVLSEEKGALSRVVWGQRRSEANGESEGNANAAEHLSFLSHFVAMALKALLVVGACQRQQAR